MGRDHLLRNPLLLNAAVSVAVVVALKLAAHWLGWEIISLNPLFSGIVAANVFLMGFLLSGVLTDQQEAMLGCGSFYGTDCEVDGVDYQFVTAEDFALLRKRGEFLECFEVFGQGVWYGTLLGEVTPGLQQGKWVVLNIDVQGALAVVARDPRAITIFIRPSSLAVLEERLRGRGTETESSLQRRLEQARKELALADRYQHQVVNDDVGQAAQEICDILRQASASREEEPYAR